MFGFDFFGLGGHRRWALQVLDKNLVAFEVNPAYVDNGMRYAVYKWAMSEIVPRDTGALEKLLRDAAALMSFCIIGGVETESLWGVDVRRERQARFDAAIDGDDETFDARLIKLVLVKDVAAPDIAARAYLDDA